MFKRKKQSTMAELIQSLAKGPSAKKSNRGKKVAAGAVVGGALATAAAVLTKPKDPS